MRDGGLWTIRVTARGRIRAFVHRPNHHSGKNYSSPPLERIVSAAWRQSSRVAFENCCHLPCEPPTAHPSAVSPCLFRWLASEPPSSKTATTSGRPKKAAHPRAMASVSASRRVTSAPYSSSTRAASACPNSAATCKG